MKELDPQSQEMLIEALNNKMSGVDIETSEKSKNTIKENVRKYRKKVISDLKNLFNETKDDPDNKDNKLTEILKELESQKKLRTAHEKTIEEQKSLITELLKKIKTNKTNTNPGLERVRRDSLADDVTPLPPIANTKANHFTARGAASPNLNPPFASSPTKSIDTVSSTAMFQLQLGMENESSPSPTRGKTHRLAQKQSGRGGPKTDRDTASLGHGGPVFGQFNKTIGRGGPLFKGPNRSYGHNTHRGTKYRFGRF